MKGSFTWQVGVHPAQSGRVSCCHLFAKDLIKGESVLVDRSSPPRLHHLTGQGQRGWNLQARRHHVLIVPGDNKLGGWVYFFSPRFSLSSTLHIPRTMSLPAAPKQTAEKPAPGAVMEPMNKDDQAADIDRKVSPRTPPPYPCPRIETFLRCLDSTLRRHSSLP